MLVTWSILKSFVQARELSIQWLDINNKYFLKAIDGPFILECELYKDAYDLTEIQDFENNFKSNGNKRVGGQEPFATPTYRTKRNATSSIQTCAANANVTINHLLAAERYVHGGALIVKNPEMGDYFYAEVRDVDGVIPAPYRAALCESWPTVASYVEKEWIKVDGSGYAVHELNTYPLNAKITAGLYLSLTYYAVNAGSTREIGINYFMTKKI